MLRDSDGDVIERQGDTFIYFFFLVTAFFYWAKKDGSYRLTDYKTPVENDLHRHLLAFSGWKSYGIPPAFIL